MAQNCQGESDKIKLTEKQKIKLFEFLEDSADNISRKQLLKFYVRYPFEEQQFLGPSSLRIEGERGTGKSTLLLTAHERLKETINNPESDVIAFSAYINIANNFMNEMTTIFENNKNKSQARVIAFDYIAHSLIINMLNELTNYFSSEKFKFYPSFYSRYSSLFGKTELNKLKKLDFMNFTLTLKSFWSKKRTLIIKNAYDTYLEYHIFANSESFTTFFAHLASVLSNSLDGKDSSNIKFVFLLDDYDSLNEEEQLVFNTLINTRNVNVKFKMGFRPGGMIVSTIRPNWKIQTHDIEFKSINQYGDQRLTNRRIYHDFFKKIANNRFKLIDPQLRIEKILGESVVSTKAAELIRKEYEDNSLPEEDLEKYLKKIPTRGQIQFFGFEDVVSVSSGIIRYFLRLIKNLIAYHLDENIITIPIPHDEQAKIIREFSEQIFKETIEELPDEFRTDITDLVNIFGGYFKKRLFETKIKLNAIAAFKIENFDGLTDNMKELLRYTVKHSVIQRSSFRKDKVGRYSEHVFHLNYIYTPILNIIPLSRDTIRLKADEMNLFLEDKKAFEKILERKIESHKPRSRKQKPKLNKDDKNDSQTILDDFF